MESLKFFNRKKRCPRNNWTRSIRSGKSKQIQQIFCNCRLWNSKKLDIDLNYEKNTNFEFEPFNFEDESIKNIEKIIDNLKSNVATGIDGIPSKIIKQAKSILSPYVTNIINLSYECRVFPNILKKAVIKPIYKKDDKNDISNYRPISLLPVISKIFERAALN